ncbi:cytochrome c oxidase assembly protein [Luteimonas sp. R10]|uniref:cytochrome c oxidase assembly protein n=1 Tax=Luteimonas sp. R10 TaxID=3108176 RepID=UPI0030849C57|nr:cytochrome c oxidase assembly protein [Luteimonas sp. R10]
MSRFADLLLPWEASPLTLAACGGAMLLYALGLARGAAPAPWRIAAFVAGIGLMYLVMQTRLDYYARYLFFAHRGQHLVLHHLAPFLIAASAPAAVLAAAVPAWRSVDARAPRLARTLRRGYRLLQTPWLAATLFVGLIAFWLIPPVHFAAMLDQRLYWLMNWSMALDGLLFWWLVFADERDGATPRLTLGGKLLLLIAIIPPQVLLGASIALAERPLFDVYDVCGRALAITALDDQHIGGLLTWLPPVMMSMAGVLVLLARRLGRTGDAEPALPDPAPAP